MTSPATNNPLSIIQDAYFDAGLLGLGQNVNGEQVVLGMRRLTDLINLWQTQGLKLWLNIITPVTLVAGTSTYTLGPAGSVTMTKPLRVVEAWYTDASGNRRPIYPLAQADYAKLSTVTQQGTVTQYWVQKYQSILGVFFWNTPDATAALGLVYLILQTQVTNFVSVTEEMNFPIEWRMALRWGLADELATGQPQAIMDRCQARALAYRTMLEDWDVEDAPVRFTPDSQGTYPSRFR